MKDSQDAFGHALHDYFRGDVDRVRTLGWEPACKVYFSVYEDWFERERKAIAYARGRVLDIGCAAGRHSLYLQARGDEVLAIDNSPLAVEVCRLRGVKRARALSVTNVSSRLGIFDTILMFGNNFGLLGDLKRARRILKKFRTMTPADGRILAGSGAVTHNADPKIQAQIALNKEQGKLPGEFHLDKRYGDRVLPIDWLYASKEDVEHLLAETGWRVIEFIDDETTAFVAVIEKNPG